ncbi:MAG: phospholipase [Bacteroidaceae bacterium]|nr:phospholipase [Bacteroidaceae bacterium]
MKKKEDNFVCCGQHAVCERESLLAAASRDIEYYEDEELDRFRGRATDSFSDAETEEFREVLYTMRPDEVAGWIRSLTLREVPLPDGIRDEVLVFVEEQRGTL